MEGVCLDLLPSNGAILCFPSPVCVNTWPEEAIS